MIRVETSTEIGSSPQKVFEFLSDVDNFVKWQKGVIESKRLTEGPVRVGFQFEETAKVALWTLHTVCTITDLVANERMAFEARSSGPLDYQGNFELQPLSSGGTLVSLQGTAHLKGVWRLLQPLLASDLRKETREELATMKRLLEASEQGEVPSPAAPANEP